MTGPNAAQAEFWSGDAGQRWVTHHRDLDLLHDAVRALLMARAAPAPGERVLDVGCGGGALTLSAARAVGPDGAAHGVDISAPLLALAEADRTAADLRQARFLEADAQVGELPGPYDLVLSRFGVMFFDDPEAAFARLRAALAPGGRMLFAAWSEARHNPWFGEARAVAVDHLGAPPAGDPDAPGPMAFRDPARVQAILAAAGWRDITVEPVDLSLHHPEGWPAMERLLPAIGPIPSVLRDMGGSAADRAAILARMHRRWERYLSADGIRLPARVNLVAARG